MVHVLVILMIMTVCTSYGGLRAIVSKFLRFQINSFLLGIMGGCLAADDDVFAMIIALA